MHTFMSLDADNSRITGGPIDARTHRWKVRPHFQDMDPVCLFFTFCPDLPPCDWDLRGETSGFGCGRTTEPTMPYSPSSPGAVVLVSLVNSGTEAKLPLSSTAAGNSTSLGKKLMFPRHLLCARQQ